MIKYTRLFITFLLAVCVLEARSQSTATTSSPYSQYGLGDINPQWMPQNIGMGGISTATNNIGGYNTINVMNPASYAKIFLTTIDAGLYNSQLTLKNDTAKQHNANTRLSHIVFAFPISKGSAISFGLLPYSELGYNYKVTRSNLGTHLPSDTNTVNYIYSGEGGLSKAYFGYGFAIGKHLTVGANASYIFGSLKQDQSTELPNVAGLLNSRVEQDNHVGGFNFDYGAQYTIDFSNTKHLILGYSASTGNKLNVSNTFIVSQYYFDAVGNENVAADSLVYTQNPKAKIQLPRINHYGIVFQKDNSFMIGVDYTNGKWQDLSIAGVPQGLQSSQMFNIGGQFTPNINALNNYFALIDYRIGFLYEDTYLNIAGNNIKRYAATFGLGIPLPHDRASSAFYKVNISAEVGKRGTISNGLIQENYVNFHLGFTLNDQWFRRFKFD